MVRFTTSICAVALLGTFFALTAVAKDKPPLGVIAASAADEVLVVDPATGVSRSVPTGPVAWLFPAPAGILFAPDLVNGKTTVVDLRNMTVRDPIPGITMPRFGSLTDRYVVVTKQLLVMSYPERALMNQFEIPFQRPWQVAVVAENTVLFVLERSPEGGDGAILTAVSLTDGRLVYRHPLHGDVRFFALSLQLGVMALAEAESGQVMVVEPATLAPVAVFQTAGKPVDVVFTGDGSILVTAVERRSGGGEIEIWKLTSDTSKDLRRKKEWTVPLAAAPVRLAGSPDGRHVAVGLENGELHVLEMKGHHVVAAADIRAAPRDVVWCDPSVEGPLLPDWSDDDEPKLNLGGR